MDKTDGHFQLLWNFLKDIASVPITEWLYAIRFFHKLTLQKGEHFFQAGDLALKVGILTTGTAYVFYQMEDGTRAVRRFFQKGDRCGSYPAVLYGSPAPDTFEALENSTIIWIYYKDLKSLFERHICWERLMRKTLENEIEEREVKEVELFTMSLDERYRNFCKRFPNLSKKIPQYLIASYLGVTPVALSRLRGKNAKN